MPSQGRNERKRSVPGNTSLLLPPAYGEGGHCTFAGRRVATCGVFVILSQSGERLER